MGHAIEREGGRRRGRGCGCSCLLPWNFKITYSDFGQLLILPISEPSNKVGCMSVRAMGIRLEVFFSVCNDHNHSSNTNCSDDGAAKIINMKHLIVLVIQTCRSYPDIFEHALIASYLSSYPCHASRDLVMSISKAKREKISAAVTTRCGHSLP